MSASGKSLIAADALLGFARDILQAGGFSADHAVQTADLLVWANLRGVDSHGVLRIPRYVEMAGLGIINTKAEPAFVREFGATAILDADRAPGPVGLNLATDKAIALAKTFGIGWCSVKNITHAGAVGYYAQNAARAGMIGVIMTASKPLMVYHGSKSEGVSTNPIAIAAPTSDPARPIVLDMSTAAVALGKIMAARDAGNSIPADWGVDANGMPTTDPAAVKSLLPMAGAKGSGLSLMIEILASVLVANPIISASLNGDKDPPFNGLVLAIDPMAFVGGDDFTRLADELVQAIRALPPAEDATQVLLPGGRGALAFDQHSRDGIPLARGTLVRLIALAKSMNVAIPQGVG